MFSCRSVLFVCLVCNKRDTSKKLVYLCSSKRIVAILFLSMGFVGRVGFYGK